MDTELVGIYDALKAIRTALIKKGKERYKGNFRERKFEEASSVIKKFSILQGKLAVLRESKQLTSEASEQIDLYLREIEKLIEEITRLCTMDNFDIKTAASLLPISDGSQSSVKQLIDNIEMYSSLLDSAGKLLLINFVLKTRLPESAKLRLSASYTSINDLVKDMRSHLLTKKSFTSLQSQLLKCNQNRKPIDDFGTELEKLFTDLTISQADGNEDNYRILFPLNEKLAIKRFCDGLSDRRLSTIIAARNYGCLKDAIRAAKDEELSELPSTSSQPTLMHMRRGIPGTQGSYPAQRYHRGFQNYRGKYSYDFNPSYSRGYNNGFQNRNQAQHRPNRHYFSRGRVSGRNFNTQYKNVHVIVPSNENDNHNDVPQNEEDHPDNVNMNHFFRA